MLWHKVIGAGASIGPAEWADPDLTNASYDNVSFSVADTIPTGVFFKPDGSKMYYSGNGSDKIYEYDLTAPWDFSTLTLNQDFTFSHSGPTDLWFSPNGSILYVPDNNTDLVYEYPLTTSWDVSTINGAGVTTLDVSGQTGNPQGVFVSEDGLHLYVCDRTNGRILQYDMSSSFDISTATLINNVSVSAQSTLIQAIFFNPDGTKFWWVSDGTDLIYQYSLSTAWDVTSASYDSISFSVGSQQSVPLGISFKSDGSKMYIIGSGTDAVHQYSTA